MALGVYINIYQDDATRNTLQQGKKRMKQKQTKKIDYNALIPQR